MRNKKGLVIGVANQKSIAWGISEVLSKEGANLALTYQGNSFKKRVQPLAESIGSELIFDVDVQDESALDSCFKKISDEWGSIDFLVHAVAFSEKSELMGRLLIHLLFCDPACFFFSFPTLTILSISSLSSSSNPAEVITS